MKVTNSNLKNSYDDNLYATFHFHLICTKYQYYVSATKVDSLDVCFVIHIAIQN